MKTWFVGLCLLVLCLSCSENSQTETETADDSPIRYETVTEYAKAICDSEDWPDDITWKEFTDILQKSLERAESIIPPEEVRDYHLAGIALIKAYLTAISELSPNPDSIFNEYELMNDESLWRMSMPITRVREDLDADSRRILGEHGCNVE